MVWTCLVHMSSPQSTDLLAFLQVAKHVTSTDPFDDVQHLSRDGAFWRRADWSFLTSLCSESRSQGFAEIASVSRHADATTCRSSLLLLYMVIRKT